MGPFKLKQTLEGNQPAITFVSNPVHKQTAEGKEIT